jgi:peptidase M23-like protein
VARAAVRDRGSRLSGPGLENSLRASYLLVLDLRPIIALGSLCAALAAAPSTASAYPWPVKPFDRQHPIRGNFGDPRTMRGTVDLQWDNPLSFHSGVDVQAPDGSPVYAVEAGEVLLSARRVVVATPWASPVAPVIFGYWHVDGVVSRFQYVARGQLLGYVHPGAGHVHLSEKRYGRYVNPLRRGGLEPYVDRTPPVVTRLVVYRSGTSRELPLDAVSGAVDLAVEAYDAPPMRPTGAWSGAVVSPAHVSWSGLFSGSWLPLSYRAQLVDFTQFPTASVRDVYAPGTRQNEAGTPGMYRFWLVRHLDTALLADGPQSLRVVAADIRGNTTVKRLTFTVGAADAAGASG